MSDRLAVLPQYLLPKQALTTLAGKLASAQAGGLTTSFIRWFVGRYGVNMDEAANPDGAAYATFNEFFTRPRRDGARPLAPASAREAVAALSELPVVSADADLVLAGIELSDRYQISLRDGLIVQAAVTAGCETILTEDLADGSLLAGVRIQNPFATTGR